MRTDSIISLLVLSLTGLTGLSGCSAGTSDRDAVDGAGDRQRVSVVDSAVTADTIADTIAGPIDLALISLSRDEYIVEDTATSAALRLHVRNRSDRLALIDRVEPSCGCIMTTVQRRNARPGDSAEIYIGLMVDQMSRRQPYTVDVYMTTAPERPLRLTIWRREAYDHRND